MRELTAEEEEISANGPKFSEVKPTDIFGASSSCALSNRVRVGNPKRWLELQLEYKYLSGELARPDSYYG